jgi:hypothetical protein
MERIGSDSYQEQGISQTPSMDVPEQRWRDGIMEYPGFLDGRIGIFVSDLLRGQG